MAGEKRKLLVNSVSVHDEDGRQRMPGCSAARHSHFLTMKK